MDNIKQSSQSSNFLGIEAECRAVQFSKGSQAAATWWERNFGHKYIDYVYDVRLERIVKRGNT